MTNLEAAFLQCPYCGEQIELQVDNFATREEAHEYFRSDAFAKNPLGVMVDPDDLLARFRAGEDQGTLLRAGTRTAQQERAVVIGRCFGRYGRT